MIAKFIKTVFDESPRLNQKLWEMDPPLDGHKFVVSSAATIGGAPETYLFPSYPDGRIFEYFELNGSLRGTLRHEDAIHKAGYKVIP